MSALTSNRTYAALAAMQVADGAACAAQLEPIKKAFDTVGVPEELRRVIPVVKVASAVGLLSVYRYPALARLTTFMLTIYFVLAVGSHVRVKDWGPNVAAASALLLLFGSMTVKGPDAASS